MRIAKKVIAITTAVFSIMLSEVDHIRFFVR